ncbi:unnamed protein product [Clonostachys rhizophaga]|uniref:Chalcone isomerase domain-containing protein n=1 Tax=Clonostachys rhizophaga TaxID=160324 RepID=A0A9N9W2A8_9HYPO|nr:unnamed protein product [Clonostachys rhizophaga]
MIRPAAARRVIPRTRCTQTLRSSPAAARRTFLSSKSSVRATQDFDLNKLNTKRRDYEHNRTAFLIAGTVAGVTSFIYTAFKLKDALKAEAERRKNESSAQCDAPTIPKEQFKTEAGEKRKVVVHDEDGQEIVPTGNGVVPAFPRLLNVKLPSEQTPQGPIAASISDNDGTEFTLVGLGTRTVTFIGIQVYVLGFYVATQDVAKLQSYLVKSVNSLATTLIPSEKETLRKSLLDPAEGEETWDKILRDAGCRTIFRITPVKDTDFHHLRDAMVRAITGRSQRDAEHYGDEQFGTALKDFKGLFNRGSVPKTKEILLSRDGAGQFSLMFDTSGRKSQKTKKEVLGVISDERISRLLWLNYLAGKKPASEEARTNIIDGIMEFVERPIGTVAAQVL